MFILPQAPQPSLADLAYASWQAGEELARQKAIVRARDYYDGQQLTFLSARLKEILSLDTAVSEDLLFHLNICDKIITAIVERLNVTGFKSDDATAEDEGQGGIVEDWWQSNRLDGQQWDAYEAMQRDGECFQIVDMLDGAPRLTLHPRYTSTEAGGDGYGVRAFYPNGDPSQPMERAAKRWTEDYTDDRGARKSRQRMTVYYPDAIYKYALDSGMWKPFADLDEAGNPEEWPLPWIGLDGEPLGIAAIHYKNRGLKCEIDSSVVSMQNLQNKTLIDLAESSDQAAFRIYKAFGFIPTKDGQPLKADGSNRLTVKPNQIIGTTKPPSEAAFDAIPGESPDPLVTLVEKIQLWVARMKDIPSSRFQITGQVASGETLKQQDAPLLARCRQLQVVIGDAWEDAMYLARRLYNTFGDGGLDESVTLTAQWASPEVRSDDRDDPVAWWGAAAQANTIGGLALFKVYAKRMGWTDADLANVPDTVPAAGAANPAVPGSGPGIGPMMGGGASDGIAAIQAQIAPHLAELKAALAANGTGG